MRECASGLELRSAQFLGFAHLITHRQSARTTRFVGPKLWEFLKAWSAFCPYDPDGLKKSTLRRQTSGRIAIK